MPTTRRLDPPGGPTVVDAPQPAVWLAPRAGPSNIVNRGENVGH